MVVEMPWEYNVLGNQIGELCDCPGFGDGSNRRGQLAGAKGSPSNPKDPIPAEGLHSGVWNYLFVDGHVKAMRPEATIDNNKSDDADPTKKGTLEAPLGLWTLSETD